MKVTLLPENLINYVPLLNKILPSHSQVPILGNLLLTANENGFYIKATDLEKGVEIKIPAKIESQGSMTVPGKEFLETINSLPKDKVTISLEKDLAVVLCRSNRITFNTIAFEEFPQLYKEKGEKVSDFSREEFLDIFSYLTFSVSSDDIRPQLTGVYIDSRSSGVNFVSTDGYRMSVKQYGKNKNVKKGLIVAVGLLNEVMGLKTEEIISLYVNTLENQIFFEVGDVLLLGRMIEGDFPDYEKVIPTSAKTVVTFDRDDLLRNVKLASVFARDNSNIATIEIIGGSIKLHTKAQGVGVGEVVTECTKEGDDNKISFNIRFLLDLLKTVVEKDVVLKLNSPVEPALFEVKEKSFLHVIMPIQVED